MISVSAVGKKLGARRPPSCLAKFCFPACAISGNEHGYLTEGIGQGTAFKALLLSFCGLGWIVSLFCWQPDPEKIQGDGTQRTIKNRRLATCLMPSWSVVAFWQSGDACSSCGKGDVPLLIILQRCFRSTPTFFGSRIQSGSRGSLRCTESERLPKSSLGKVANCGKLAAPSKALERRWRR
ncbi:unnamed protein product [Polarella glacialis]|uniref:Uncharacterized protein n=1 Tax=Polarella glacialis TaxID=89957 RepID=A0A813DGA4_POLGL|nr:unnamed protein product [Polarella glacialis]CAE8656317.1 unnamed protein product [Polarella glacialis]